MIRLYLVVEGQTEDGFVRQLLAPHLRQFGIEAQSIIVTTSHDRATGRKRKGGAPRWARVRHDLDRLLKSQHGGAARFSMMVDYNRLPDDYPGFAEARKATNAAAAVRVLESELSAAVADSRFIPYIQLHEFEALLLSDPQQFAVAYPDDTSGVAALVTEVESLGPPETIDDGLETAPSRRIAKWLPRYLGQKPTASILVAVPIGLSRMRKCCPHFGSWLSSLEGLAS